MRTLVVGAAIVDIIMNIDSLPKSGEDVLCHQTKTVVGGCAYNVARTLSNLGCCPKLCVPIGTGTYGSLITNQLKLDGYDILIRDKEQDNGYCLSLVEADGERTFITVQGAECHFKSEWFDKLPMDEFDNIYVAGYQVCGKSGEVIAEWLGKQQQKNIYFAPGPVITSIDKQVMAQIFAVHPILHLNQKEAFDFTGQETLDDCLRFLYDKTKNLVFITLGAGGTIYFDGSTSHHAASEKTSVVDTIGAGDSHIAAIIGGLEKGLSIEESVALANQTAAIIVGIKGPTIAKNEFQKKLGENYGKIKELF